MRTGEEKGLWLIDTDGKSSQRRRIRGFGRFSWEEILMCASVEKRSRRGAAAYIKAFGCYCDTHSLKAKRNRSGLRCPYLSSVMAEEQDTRTRTKRQHRRQ